MTDHTPPTRTTVVGGGDRLPQHLMIVPWDDPLVDAHGFDMHSEYVDLFWLSTLGPSATWLMRHLHRGLARYPHGFEQDLDELAATLGLGKSMLASGPFARAFSRCVMFGLARPIAGALAVRRKVPPLSARQLARLPDALVVAHHSWRQRVTPDERQRADTVAAALAEVGQDPEQIERSLLANGIAPAVAVATAADLSVPLASAG